MTVWMLINMFMFMPSNGQANIIQCDCCSDNAACFEVSIKELNILNHYIITSSYTILTLNTHFLSLNLLCPLFLLLAGTERCTKRTAAFHCYPARWWKKLLFSSPQYYPQRTTLCVITGLAPTEWHIVSSKTVEYILMASGATFLKL